MSRSRPQAPSSSRVRSRGRRSRRTPASGAIVAGLIAVSAPLFAQSPNAFLQRGAVTVVRGTLGDERCDRLLAAQAERFREQIPGAGPCVDDTSFDPARGSAGWPKNAVVLGSTDHNAVLDALPAGFPLHVKRGMVEVDGRSFSGDDMRVVAFVPAWEEPTPIPGEPPRPAPVAGWPEFVLYAGAGALDAYEIQSLKQGDTQILVVDRFGPRIGGSWKRDNRGGLHAVFGPAYPRETWRDSTTPALDDARPLVVHHPRSAPAGAEDEKDLGACRRALDRACGKMQLARCARIDVYLHPDAASKLRATGNGTDAHCDPAARVLHVVAGAADMEDLVAYEAARILAVEKFGGIAAAPLAEGLAAWAAGRVAGKDLGTWKVELAPTAPSVAGLLADARIAPRGPHAVLDGLLVGALLEARGFDRFETAFAPTASRDWASACERAGTDAAAVEAVFRRALGRE